MDTRLDEIARNFSKRYPIIDNVDRRHQKGLKAAAVLKDVLRNREVHHVLDVGCSNAGFLDVVVEELKAGFGIGIDLDVDAIPKPTCHRVAFIANALALPIPDESIEVILCNHTYEHVSDARMLFQEIRRVLKPGGVVYFAAMNSRWPLEPHYNVPFIHWLPANWSLPIMQMFGYSVGYIERPMNTSQLRRLVAGFDINDYTLKVIADPIQYHAEDMVHPKLTGLLSLVARVLYRFLPVYIWVLVKPCTN